MRLSLLRQGDGVEDGRLILGRPEAVIHQARVGEEYDRPFLQVGEAWLAVAESSKDGCGPTLVNHPVQL